MPPTAHNIKRSSHLARQPILATGPGGDFVDRQYISGQAIVRLPEPAPEGVPMLKRRVARPSQGEPTPWRWVPFFKGVGYGMLSGLGLIALFVAIPVALCFAPLVWGSHHVR